MHVYLCLCILLDSWVCEDAYKRFSKEEEAVLIALSRCDWQLFSMDGLKLSVVPAYKLVSKVKFWYW